MKTFHLYQFKAVFVMAAFFLLQSCISRPGNWKNDKISAGKRDEFHQLNAEVLRKLKMDEPKALVMLFSKELNAQNTSRMINLLSNRLNENEYQLLDEYYVVHKYSDNDTVHANNGNTNRYDLVYPFIAREMYLAYFLPKKGNNKYMISLVYAKLSYGWKIMNLGLEPYTINGKTGPELYQLARQQYSKQQAQAAMNNISLAIACFAPGDYWVYPDKGDATGFFGKLSSEVNLKYKYPLVLNQIDTGPMILRVYNKTIDDNACPMIYYMTHFPLKDTTEIKNENLKIRKVVANIMPGLAEHNKYILYSAFNKQPTGYNTVEHFDMTQTVR